MKRILLLLLLNSLNAFTEDPLDSLRKQLTLLKLPVEKIDLLNALSHAYTQVSLEYAEQFGHEALLLATTEKYERWRTTFSEANLNNYVLGAQIQEVTTWNAKGDYNHALKLALQIKQLLDPQLDLFSVIELYGTIGNICSKFKQSRFGSSLSPTGYANG